METIMKGARAIGPTETLPECPEDMDLKDYLSRILLPHLRKKGLETDSVRMPEHSESPSPFGLLDLVFEGQQVRAAIVDKKPCLCGIDVARILGYSRPADAVSQHCKGVVVLPTPSTGGTQRTKFIGEADVYRLVLRSKAPHAEKFQDWLCEEVLPSIREKGFYDVAASAVTLPAQRLRLHLRAAELRAEADRVSRHARALRAPERPEGWLTIGEFLGPITRGRDSVDQTDPAALSMCSKMAARLRDCTDYFHIRDRQRKLRKTWSRETLESAYHQILGLADTTTETGGQ